MQEEMKYKMGDIIRFRRTGRVAGIVKVDTLSFPKWPYGIYKEDGTLGWFEEADLEPYDKDHLPEYKLTTKIALWGDDEQSSYHISTIVFASESDRQKAIEEINAVINKYNPT